MPDEQDTAEIFDEEKLGTNDPRSDVIDLVDQTADAEPGDADAGRAEIDAGETGDALDGVEEDADRWPDPAHDETPPAEVAAMHVVEEP
jgi:hypothetical protein